MSKVLVAPLKGHGLVNQNNDWLAHNRPSVTVMSQLLQQRIGNKEFRVAASELSNEATDAEFVKFLSESDGNVRLAVESFESKYSEDPMKRETEEQKKERLAAEAKAKADAAAQEKAEKARVEKEAKDKEVKDKAIADAAEKERVKKEADDKIAAQKAASAEAERNKPDTQAGSVTTPAVTAAPKA